MFKPGYLAKKFLEGKRLLYLHPAQMYLFVSVIFFFVFSFTINDWIKEANKANKEIAKSDTLLSFSEGKGLGNLIKRFVDTIPIAMFFLLPLFAFILKIFYFRRGPYAYHLVFSFYFFSFLFTVFCLIVSFNRFVTEIPMEINWLIVLSTFVYFYLALLNFYNRNWFTTLIKSGVITFIFLLMVMPFASLLIGAFAIINA